MHFYLLRGTDKDGKATNHKIIAHSDLDAKTKRQELHSDITMTELLACEVINWMSPSIVKLHKGRFYLVTGQITMSDTSPKKVENIEQKVNATCDEEAAYTVAQMYRDHKIEKAQLLRCRVVEKRV